jgi:hypothetical protein
MKNFFKKYWYHFTVWILMLLFLAFGPKLVAVFRGAEGRPVAFKEALPEPDAKITSNVEILKSMYSKGQKSEQLDGWAFLFGTADQSLYDRYLVLKSDTQTLFFPLKDVQRLDVQSAFSASGLDLQYSGFSATIFSDELASGTYQIGFVFQHRQNGSLVYGLSNGMLKRTPNTLTLTTIAPPTATRPPDSTMVNLDRHLPDPSDTITDYLDGLSADNSSEITQYKLSGWAFLPGEADQSKFERLIILRSSEYIYALQATSVPRPDVQKAYQGQGIDVSNSGFAVYYSEGSIAPGEYSIGILFKLPDGEYRSYAVFQQKLIQHNDAWILADKPLP